MIEIVDLCQGGVSGFDLVMLPYPDRSIYDNPNIFFEARRIINDVKAKFMKENEPKDSPKGGRK